MIKYITHLIIFIIKLYKYLISPLLGDRCRYLPTCSNYFIEAINIHGIIKGSYLGFKRILRCHPVKLIGGNSGLDFVPNKKNLLKGKK